MTYSLDLTNYPITLIRTVYTLYRIHSHTHYHFHPRSKRVPNIHCTGYIRTHITTSTPGQREYLTCHLCCKSYSKSYNLKRHVYTVHLKIERVKCHSCLLTFSQSGSMYSHMRKYHPEDYRKGHETEGFHKNCKKT